MTTNTSPQIFQITLDSDELTDPIEDTLDGLHGPCDQLRLFRQVRNTSGHLFTAIGPNLDSSYTVWAHEYAAYMGRFTQADDAVDLMLELAAS